MMNIFFGILGFSLFVLLQAIFINGVHQTFKGECRDDDIKKGRVCTGLIFFPIAQWMDAHIKQDWVKKPLYKCVRCMASVWGGITYWPAVLIFIGYRWQEIPIFIFDMFLLVVVNFYIYKKI